LPALEISSYVDAYSTEESASENNSDQDSDVDMGMENDLDAPDSIDLDSNVDMERDGEDEKEEDEVDDNKEEEDEDEEKDMVEDEEEIKAEDDGKEPRKIGQGEMVNSLADEVCTLLYDQPVVLSEQGQEMGKHTPRPQPAEPAKGQKPRRLAHNHKHRKLISLVSWNIWGF
jgi:hypothetical protein